MSPPAKKIKLENLASFSSKYYPKHVSTKTILKKYSHEENKPINVLNKALADTKEKRQKVKVEGGVAHLFLRDLRQYDNHGLSKAAQLAEENNVPLITFFVYCLEDLLSHSVSGFQLQYKLRSLQILKKDLEKKNVPLYILDVAKKKDIAGSIVKFLQENKASHLFSNIQYEVDELRGFTQLTEELIEKSISFEPVHDTCVVTPGELKTKSKGTQYAVFTPWYKAWVAYLKSKEKSKKEDAFPEYPSPKGNDEKAKKDFKKLFDDSKIPSIPQELKLGSNQQKYADEHWTYGEHEAKKELLEYINSDKIKEYGDERNDMVTDLTSHMSHHLASGTIASRSIMRLILENKLVSDIDLGASGITEWIRQVSWRDFYKHVMVNWPYICMFKPFQLEYDDLNWEYNKEHFEKWCEGKTGFPIVDAAMRQLKETGYMHNRSRMIAASFLAKDLMIDWRYGEYYFLEHLIDGDFASNNGGWGFSSSVGVDPQPFFRIFNPWTQSEKYDKDGDYIRKWVPELRDIKGKAVHNPYESDQEEIAKKNGYPFPIVDHSESRERALERFKEVKYSG